MPIVRVARPLPAIPGLTPAQRLHYFRLLQARRRPRSLRGLGNCYTDAVNAGLPASADCIASVFSGPAYAPTPTLPPADQSMQTVSNVFGNPQTVFTLAAQLNEWVRGICADPYAYAGNPAGDAAQIASEYCALYPVSDCGNPSVISGAASQVSACMAGSAPQGGSAPAAGGVISSGASQSAPGTMQVSIQNVTRPGHSSFYPGDNWRIVFTGPPSSQVLVWSYQNGQAVSFAPMPIGTTDGSGQLVVTGTISAASVGTWSETWSVTGKGSATLNFTVSAQVPLTGGVTPQATNPFATLSNGPNQTMVGGGVTSSNGPNQSFVLPDLSAIPSWVLWAGGGLLALGIVKSVFK